MMMRRTSRILIEIAIVIVVGSVISVAALMWRLSRGPISLGLLTPHVAQMLTDATSLRVKIDDTILIWPGWGSPVDVRALTVSARGSDGVLIAVVPELSVRLSFRALMRGELRPVRFIVHRPVVQLVRNEDGAVRMGIGTDTGPPGGVLDSIAQSMLAPPDRAAPLGYLTRASIVDGTLRVEDRALGLSWNAPKANIGLTRDRFGVELNYDLSIALSDQKPTLKGSARIRAGMREIDIDAKVSGLWPSRLARAMPILETLHPVDLPLDARVKLTLGLGGEVNAGTVELSGGAGRLRLPGLWPKPIAVRSVKASGRLVQNPRRFFLRGLDIDLGGPRLSARAEMTVVGGMAGVSGEATMRDVPIADFVRFWPPGRVANGRNWVKANITSGVIPRANVNFLARADLAKGVFDVESISGTFDARKLTLHYFRPLQALHSVNARGRFGNDFVHFDILGGTVNGVQVTDGAVVLDQLDSIDNKLSVDVHLKGPVGNVLKVLDDPPLGYAKEIGVDPAKVGGMSVSRLRVAFPLLNKLRFKDTDIRAESEIKDLSIPDLVSDQGITKGDMSLRLDRNELTVSGRADFAGIPSDIGLNYRFRDHSAYVSRTTLKATVQNTHLARLGLDLAPYAAGQMGVDVKLLKRKDGKQVLSGAIDLSRAALALPMFDWSKPAGENAEAAFNFRIDPGRRARLETLRLRAGGLEVDGAADFALEDGWVLQGVRLDRFRLGQTDVRGTLARTDAGGFDVDIAGPVLDGAPFLKLSAGVEKKADSEPMPPIAMKLKVAKLLVAPERSLSGLSGKGLHDGVRWRSLHLSAGLGGKGTVRLDLTTTAKKRVLGVITNDGGALLQRLGVTDGLRGGLFITEARTSAVDSTQPWTGRVLMKRFRVKRTPVFARLATLASLSGIGDRLSGRGIRFARMEIPFTLRDGAIEVKNVRAVGSELGVTANGSIDLTNEAFDLKGTLVPAYTLNSLVGYIPILGRILTGAKGSGIFAVSYSVKGGFDEPKVSVNPLSVIAPGVLRNLVDVLALDVPGVDMPEEVVDP